MTKNEMVGLLKDGFFLLKSEEYKKTGCSILNTYGLDKIESFEDFAVQLFEGKKEFHFEIFQKDVERAKNMIAKEIAFLEKRGGLTHDELADKIMQGIVNGSLGIRYAEIAPYSHGFEVTFGGNGTVGSTRDFKNRWECYCDFFDIGTVIAGKIENTVQDSATFGKKCEQFDIEHFLDAIEKRESERITAFTPEKDTDFKRAKNSYTYPYRSDVATIMDVHAGKGLDGIVKHHYHGTYETMTPTLQNSLVEMMVCLNGFCLDCVNSLDVKTEYKKNIVEYLDKHGVDISTPEKLDEWVRNNPEKCALEENRKQNVVKDSIGDAAVEKRHFEISPEIHRKLLDKGFDDEDIQSFIDDWGADIVEKGYDIFEVSGSNVLIENALVVEMISDFGLFDGDFEACRQAEKDGVKFINDVDGLEKGCYVDTPENREHCINMLKKHPEYRVENWLDMDGEYGQKYARYFGNPNKEKSAGLDEKISLAKESVIKRDSKEEKKDMELEK